VRGLKLITGLCAAAALSALSFAGVSAAASTTGGLRAVAAGADSTATAAAESLVRYLPRGRLPVKRRIAYRGVCQTSAPNPPDNFCSVVSRTTLVLPGPNLGPITLSNSFSNNQVFEVHFTLNGPAFKALKKYRNKARLRTRLRATDLTNGSVDVDRRTFRFKRKR
jgi:hypothetical protein